MTLPCSYCEFFQKPIKTNKTEGFRICKAEKIVTIDSKICEQFEVAEFFHCIKYSIRMKLNMCLNRRESNINAYAYCKKCRQFEKEIN